MNVRIFAAVALAALILAVIELACLANEYPSATNDYPSAAIPAPSGLYTEAPEPELPAAPDPRSLPSPVLTR